MSSSIRRLSRRFLSFSSRTGSSLKESEDKGGDVANSSEVTRSTPVALPTVAATASGKGVSAEQVAKASPEDQQGFEGERQRQEEEERLALEKQQREEEELRRREEERRRKEEEKLLRRNAALQQARDDATNKEAERVRTVNKFITESLIPGLSALKHGRSGKPHTRIVFCDASGLTIRWKKDGDGGPKSNGATVTISEIWEVVLGDAKPSTVVQRSVPSGRRGNVVSLICPTRTLDLEFESREVAKSIQKRFRMLISDRQGVTIPPPSDDEVLAQFEADEAARDAAEAEAADASAANEVEGAPAAAEEEGEEKVEEVAAVAVAVAAVTEEVAEQAPAPVVAEAVGEPEAPAPVVEEEVPATAPVTEDAVVDPAPSAVAAAPAAVTEDLQRYDGEAELTLRDISLQGHNKFGGLVALVDESSGVETTYSELHLRSNRLAHGLAAAGVNMGDNVSIISENVFRYVEFYFAVFKLGAAACPVAHMLADDEMVNVINGLDAELILVHRKFEETFTRIRPRLTKVRLAVLFDSTPTRTWDESSAVASSPIPEGCVHYEQLMASNSEAEVTGRHVRDDSTAIMFLTSGTTGTPKAAMLSHRALMTTIVNSGKMFTMPGTSICLYNSYAWIGAVVFSLAGLANAGKIIMVNGYDKATFWPTLVKHQAKIGFLLPQLMKDILTLRPAMQQQVKDSLAVAIYGGGVVPIPVVKQVLELLAPKMLIHGYAMTEMMGLAVSGPANNMPAIGKPMDSDEVKMLASAGKPSIGVIVRVVRPDDTLCAPNESGEVVARGPTMMTGYYNRPDATAKTLRGGWLRTGDVGYQDENGNLFINSRVKDMINMDSGYNVYPVEIENVLFQMTCVKEVAVVGICDADGGNERPVACIVLNEGWSAPPHPSDFIEFCKGKLAEYKYPTGVAFFSALPHNENGKVLKRELRERVPAVVKLVAPPP